MTIEEEYLLSCYETLTRLHENKDIFLVRHQDTGKLYVKKYLSVYHKEVYQRLRELAVPNIPQIHFCEEKNGKLIVIEDYIKGQTLHEYCLENGAMSEQLVKKISLDICRILTQLHNQMPALIHRDIKPSNIMLSDDGVTKLIDFNAARMVSANQTEDTEYIGTQDYAAPEQYGFGQSDARTDVFALGVTMNVLLTGQLPKNQLVEGSLSRVIAKCTQISPERRFQTVKELEKKLNHEEDDSWLPVGFRSHSWWKMGIAILGYLLIVQSCFSIVIKNSSGIAVTGVPLRINQTAIFLAMLACIALIGNYRAIHSLFPGMKSKGIKKWLACVGYCFVFFLIAVLTVTIIGF